MSTKVVDTRVVEMEFDNAQFEKNVQTSMSTLDKLKAKLESLSGKGLDKLSDSAKSFSLDDIGNSVEKLEHRFSAMGIAGMTVMSELTKSALSFGKTLVDKVLQPIKSGGWSRASNIANAQFMIEGLKKDWSKVYDAANYAVTGTAYGFDAAAKAASSLAASGVRLDDTLKTVKDDAQGVEVNISSMHQALRGISGVAAMSNSSYEEIASIFTTVAGQGKLMTMQLRQLEARGLNVAATLGEQLGKSEAEIRDMVTKGKISFAEFSSAMDEAFGDHAKDADRTFQGVTSNIRAALARIGQMFYEPILQQDGPVVKFLQQVKKKLNEVKAALQPLADTWGVFIKNAAILGRRYLETMDSELVANTIENIVGAVTNLAKALETIIAPIHAAFKEVFNGTAIGNINSLIGAIKAFTEYLILDSTKMGNIKDGFKGVFEVIKLVGTGITNVLRIIFPFVTESDGLLDIITKIIGVLGRLLSLIAKVISEGKIITKIVNAIKTAFLMLGLGIASLVSKVIELLNKFKELEVVQKFVEALKGIKTFGVSVFETLRQGVVSFIETLRGGFREVNNSTTEVTSFVTKIKVILQELIDKVKEFTSSWKSGGLAGVISSIVNYFQDLKKSISESLNKDDLSWFDVAVQACGKFLGSLAKVINMMLDFVKAIDWGTVAVAGFIGIFGLIAFNFNRLIVSLTQASGAVTKVLGLLSGKLGGVKWKPSVLEDVAIVIGVLAISLWQLSKVDSNGLNAAADAMVKLLGAVSAFSIITRILETFGKKKGVISEFSQMGLTMAAMAGSVAMLVIALKEVGELNAENVMKQILLIGGIALALGVSIAIMSKLSPKIATGAITLLAFSFAVKQIIEVISGMQDLNLPQIKGSLVQFSALMGGLALLAAAIGRIGLGTAITILAMVVAWKLIGQEIANAVASMQFDAIGEQLENLLIGLSIISGIFIAMDVLLKKFGGGLKNLGLGVASLAIGLAILGQVAKMLGQYEGEFKKGAIRLTAIVAMIAALELIAGNVGEHMGNFLKFAIGMDILTLGMGMMVGLTYVLGRINEDTLRQGILALGSISLMIALIEGISAFTEKANVGALVAIIAGLSILMAEIAALSLIPWQNLIAPTIAMLSVMAVFALVLNQITEIKADKVPTGPLVAIAVALGILGAELVALSYIPWDQLLVSFGVMTLSMIAFAKMVQMITKVDGRTLGSNKMKAVLVGAVSLLAIGLALTLVAQQPWQSILAGTLGVGVCMFELAGIVKVISGLKIKKEVFTGLLIASLSFVAIGAALAIAASQPWGEILAAMVALSVTAGVMALALALLSKIGDPVSIIATSAALVIFGAGLIAVAAALNMMNTVDWSSIGQMAIMIGIFTALGALAGLVPVVAAGLVVAGAALLMFGGAMLMAGGGMELFSLAMERLSVIDLATIANGLTALGPALASIVMVGPGMGIAGLGMIVLAGGVLALGLSSFVANPAVLLQLSTSIAALVKSTNGLLAAAAQLAACALALTAFGIATNVCVILSAGLPVIATNITILGAAIQAFAVSVSIAIQSLVQAVQSVFDFANTMKAAAADAVTGFSKGILAGAPIMEASGIQMALGFFKGFRKITLWGSPWGTMIQAAIDAGKGFLKGNPIAEKVMQACGVEDGEAFLDGLGSTIEAGLEQLSSMIPESLKGLLSGEDFDFSSILDGVMESMPDFDSAALGADNFAGALGGVGDAAGKAKDPLQSLTDTIANQMDIFSEFDRKTEISGEQMLNNMRSQVLGVTEWANNLQSLAARGIDQGLLQKLAELGPSGYEKVAAFVSMTDGQLQEANSLFAQSLTLPSSAAQQILGSYGQAGKDASTGFANGIDTTAGNANMQALGQNGLDTLQTTLKEKSPSRATMEMGENLVKGLDQGVRNLEQLVPNRLTMLGTTIINTLKSKLTYQTFYNIGKNIGQGLTAGINNGSASVRSAVSSMANAAINAAKSRFRTASPSKVFIEIGEYLDEGLAQGVSGMTGVVTRAVSNLSDKTIDGFEAATSNINDYIDDGLNLTPIISPELDMGDISAAMDRFNSLFGDVGTVSMAYNDSRIATKRENTAQSDALYQLGSEILRAAMLNSQNGEQSQVVVNVELTGDAEDIFRVVKVENSRFIKATGTSPLFGAG